MFVLEGIWPTTVEGWVGLISLLVGLVGAIAALIPTAIKLWHAVKKIAKNKDWGKVMDIADAAMKAAEQSGKTGSEKRQMVIDMVIAGCKEIGVDVDDELLNELSDYIEETIAMFNDMSKKSTPAKKRKGGQSK